MFVFREEKEIRDIQPNFDKISSLDARGVIVTAPGKEVDFVSRFFAPQTGVLEDPVTGSAHTSLIPYWSKKWNKKELKAMQLSDRKGYLECKYKGDRVKINGQASLYMKGNIYVHGVKKISHLLITEGLFQVADNGLSIPIYLFLTVRL